ncbi:GNAT family N-acetyltransferase [Micromonospora echinofusca]|uniref:GNAT family N-acetyltransferase n=1 Tax=Micromonospora echinofusca TaxID=47858 RepID=UPI003418C76E
MLLTLRPLALDDTAAVHDWARLPESCRYQAWGPNTYEQTQAYVRAAVAAPPDRLVFGVLLDGEVVGSAELKLHGPSIAEIGYAIHPRRWGQGIATAAVLRRIGMRYEGRMRGTAHIRDGWRDSDLYAVLADD